MKGLLPAFLLVILTLSTLHGQIVINEIIPPSTVELKNLGGSTVNIGPYTLCQFPSYNQLSSITQVCGGDLMIEAGAIVAVTVTFNISAADDEMALYFMNGSFDSPGNIADYVEWGSHGHVRSSVAEAAGIWSNGDFVPAFTGCGSLEYDGSGNSSADWFSQDVATSPCMENTLDGCGGANCDIAGAGLTGVTCNNNGTPSNPNDDFISFSLNPTGVDLGTNYEVSVDQGSITPPSAAYGSATAFQLQNGSAGDGNVVVTITDEDDPSCTFMVTVTDPGSCSDECDITGAGLSGIFCNDNGTPSEGNDDFIMFNLNPTGLNLGESYSLEVSSGSVMPASAEYGSLTTFELNPGSAGNGDVTVTISDDDNPGCSFQVVVNDPGTCSMDCDLTDAGLDDVACDDNGTTTDADDFITFTLSPEGTNLGLSYAVEVSNGSINPETGNYGTSTFFTMNAGSAGGGDVTVTIRDSDDPACDIEVTINDPGACSVSCNLSAGGLTGVSCNDNGTDDNPSDDYISFSLNPTGSNLGTGYTVSVSSGSIDPLTGNYGASTQFSLNAGSAGGGNVTVTITDATDPGCTFVLVVNDPGTCSPECGLSGAGVGSIACNDNGTDEDPADDFITFTLNPTGANLGASYSVSVSAGTIDPTSVAYGSATTFTLNTGSAGAGDVTVTITDDGDTQCQISAVIADPGSCSDACNLTDIGLTGLICNSNGTMDETDDYLVFTLNPVGTGLGASYSITVSTGTVVPETGTYGAATLFTMNAGSAGGGDITLTLTDADDPLCSAQVIIADPGPCSQTCNLSATGLAEISCNDNGTTDGADDYIVFTLNPEGSLLSTGYHVQVGAGTVTPDNGLYGAVTSFRLQDGSAGAGDVSLTLVDDLDPTCTIITTVTDPGSCSEAPCEVAACDISTESETQICTDDGGVPDSVIVICAPSSIGDNTAWIITDTAGVIQSLPAHGDTAAFTFEGESAGVCLVWRIVWDGVLGGLQPGQDADLIAGCFDLSNAITVTKVTGKDCETSTFDPSLSKQIKLYPVPVTGRLIVETELSVSEIDIYSILGHQVMKVTGNDVREVDVKSLDSGVYTLIIETDRGWTVDRIVVSK